MVSTLILLYALNASAPVPDACFIVAWACLGAKALINLCSICVNVGRENEEKRKRDILKAFFK